MLDCHVVDLHFPDEKGDDHYIITTFNNEFDWILITSQRWNAEIFYSGDRWHAYAYNVNKYCGVTPCFVYNSIKSTFDEDGEVDGTQLEYVDIGHYDAENGDYYDSWIKMCVILSINRPFHLVQQ